MADQTREAGWNEIVGEILVRHRKRDGALLPILHDVQHELGFIPDEVAARIAEALNVGRAEVHGVITFYQDFRRTPPDRLVIKLCRAEACQARGCEALAVEAERHSHVTVEPVYCLGLCASGPAAMVGERIVARLTPETFQQLIAEAR